jgi:hypothetical protein
MKVKINKQAILEEAQNIRDQLTDEIRFEIKITDNGFNKLFPKNEGRIDWYFDNYRIRQFYDSTNKEFDFFKIADSSGKTIKKKTKMSVQNKKELDKKCKFKNIYTSKRPIVDGAHLYLERVDTIFFKNNNKKHIVMYTTEAETKSGLKDIPKLLQLDGLTKVTNIGNINMEEITERRINNESENK